MTDPRANATRRRITDNMDAVLSALSEVSATWPQLMHRTGLSRHHVVKAVEALEGYGLVTVFRSNKAFSRTSIFAN